MLTRTVPYRKLVLVCTNVREDGRVACANPGRGGDALCSALKEAVKARGLKGRVRVARSGCLDLCEQGPNVFVLPDGRWHAGVAEGDLPALLDEISAP
jgi:(2Fe-2S) ferredoxin